MASLIRTWRRGTPCSLIFTSGATPAYLLVVSMAAEQLSFKQTLVGLETGSYHATSASECETRQTDIPPTQLCRVVYLKLMETTLKISSNKMGVVVSREGEGGGQEGVVVRKEWVCWWSGGGGVEKVDNPNPPDHVTYPMM